MDQYKEFNQFLELQQDQSDCGVACLLSIIKYYEGYTTLEKLRRISGTNISGTTLLGLFQAAMDSGFDPEGCEADLDLLFEHQEPCILHVRLEGKHEHYIVCFKSYLGHSSRSKNLESTRRFLIGDPAKGIYELGESELNMIWFSKTCLTLRPNSRFKKNSELKKEKRYWFIELLKDDFPVLGISVAIGTVVAVLGLVMAVFSQKLIDDILPSHNSLKLNLGIILVLLFLLIKEGLTSLRQYLLMYQAKQFNTKIIDFFFKHLLLLPKTFFDSRKTGELTARLNDTGRIQRVISQFVGTVAIDSLVIIACMIVIFYYSILSGIVCLILIPSFYLLVRSFNRQIMNGQRTIMSNYAQAESNYISTLAGIETIKNNNKQSFFSLINKSIYQNYQEVIFRFGKIQIRLSLIVNCFGIFFLTGILLFNSYLVLHGKLKTGELIAILGMCSNLLPSVATLSMISIPLNEARIAFDRMFDFTSIQQEDMSLPAGPTWFYSLNIKNLSFRFPGRNLLLNNISFDVKKGEIVALMGENGSGKSTLIQILQKFYTHEEGNILINHKTELSSISPFGWRRITGLVPQINHLFPGTVLENIGFGDAFENPDKVIDFINNFGFSHYFEDLPQSYLTLVGDDGINLSGGQKQLIAFARALYNKPQLLILDEATSAMDRETEHFVLNILRKLKSETAIIFVTHKLHILKSFSDRIYILENGFISASGNHVSLLSGNNLYSRYWADIS